LLTVICVTELNVQCLIKFVLPKYEIKRVC